MPSGDRPSHRTDDDTSPAARSLRSAGEVLLLGAVAVAPWPFACADAAYESVLALVVLALAVLWAAHAALTGRLTVRPDVVTVALSGLVLWTAAQLVPLPEGVLATVSPARAEWHRTLLPAAEETLSGDPAAPVAQAAAVPLSVNPAATRALLARLLGLLVVYAAARNWLADRRSLPRLLWVLVGTGVALAAFAVVQMTTTGAPNTGYWSVPLPETPFGPFVCRNHYPDYVALCAAGALGLLIGRPGEDEGGWLTGRRPGLLLAVGFMLLTVPLSLSRGGTLSVLAAGLVTALLARVGRPRAAGRWGRVALVAAGVLAAAAGVVFGTATVEARLATLGEREALFTGRLPLWRDATQLVPRFPLAGTGGGTFEAVEPTVRTDPRAARVNFEYAHNEYLEAQVEGGAVRLGLTVLLAGGVLWAVGRGAAARRDRSVGGPLLGLWFGLAVVAMHAAGEFAVHTPAVAVAVAAVAGYAMAAAADPSFVPPRVRVRKRLSADGRSALTEVVGDDPTERGADRTLTARGPLAWAAGLAVVAAAAVVALDARTRARAAAYEQAAEAVARGYLPAADPTAQRVVYADARAAVRPDDPNGRVLAAEAHLQAAYERTLTASSAALGGAGGWAGRAEHVEDGPDVHAAVRHLQAARRASPVAAKAHARLGLLAGHFRGEPAAVHFDRAKRLLPSDPEVWYAAGREAFARGDRAAAFADWQRALGMSTGRLADVLQAVRGGSSGELRDKLLPPLAHVSLAAADTLFPDRLRQADDRRPFLEAAVKQAQDAAGPTPADWAAAAAAADELGQPEAAGRAWQTAVSAAVRDVRIRDGYARWLEQEERYDEAVDQLRQLQKLTTSPSLQDRIEGCFHAQKLLRAMGG